MKRLDSEVLAGGLRRPNARIWIMAGALALVVIALGLPHGGMLQEPATAPNPWRLGMALAHVACLCGFLILRRTRWRFDNPTALPRHPVAREAWRQFLNGVDALVLSWAALYLWLSWLWAGAYLPGILPEAWSSARLLAIADLLNAAGSVVFLYLYLVLDKPSVPSPELPDRDVDFHDAWCACVALGLAVTLAAVLGRLGWLGSVSPLGPMLGSFLAAVAMMYLFGRFDYRSMRVGRLAVAPLYLYVALQVAWDRVATTEVSLGAELAFALALVLKLYLLACLVRWARDRRLQRYFDFAAL